MQCGDSHVVRSGMYRMYTRRVFYEYAANVSSSCFCCQCTVKILVRRARLLPTAVIAVALRGSKEQFDALLRQNLLVSLVPVDNLQPRCPKSRGAPFAMSKRRDHQFVRLRTMVDRRPICVV